MHKSNIMNIFCEQVKQIVSIAWDIIFLNHSIEESKPTLTGLKRITGLKE